MKKIIVLIILLLSAAVIAQSVGWTDLMETDITVGNNNYDIFTNGAGNHIIVQETSSLKYYKMDVEGNTLSSTNLETTAVTSPSISGDASRLYVVYRKGTEEKIRTKFSSNGGVSWSYISDLNLSGSPSSIECVFSKDKLHVTYQVGSVVYFNYYNTADPSPSWLSQPFTVSGTYTATFPRIGVWNAGSEDKVYFVYNSINYLRWREYLVTLNQWSDVDWFINYGLGFVPQNLGFAVDASNIYSFHKPSTIPQTLGWTVKTVNNGSVGSGNSNGNTFVEKTFCTTTANNKSYTAAWSTIEDFPNRIVRMGFDGTAFLVYDEIHTEAGLTPVNIVNLSSAGNDVHVIWKDNLSNNKLRYKYYDDIPLTPQNFTGTIYNNNPKLTWTLNNEPDIEYYEVWRKWNEGSSQGSWTLEATTTSTSYTDIDFVITSGRPVGVVYYKIRAKDIGNHLSTYTSQVYFRYHATTWKVAANNNGNSLPKEYLLENNYPNPFNPSTQISYSLAQDADVTLSVYDILGTQVVELVNERQTAGSYITNFNAKSAAGGLSSGVYIYRIVASNNGRVIFTDSKRMMLMR